jgi:hypothetical protein
LDDPSRESALRLNPQLILLALGHLQRKPNVVVEVFLRRRMLGRVAVLVFLQHRVVVDVPKQQLVRLFALLKPLGARFNSLDCGLF